MTIEQTEIALPAHWAPFLINRDDSGFDPGEREHIDSYLARQLAGGWYVVSDVKDSERFTWSYDLHSGADTRGGSVCDYIIHRAIKREG